MVQNVKSWHLKVLKTQPSVPLFCVWHFVYIMSSTKLACMTEVYPLSWAPRFLLFTGKQQTNMAVLIGAQLERKKKNCCMNTHRTTIRSLPMEILAHFLCYWADLCLCMESPSYSTEEPLSWKTSWTRQGAVTSHEFRLKSCGKWVFKCVIDVRTFNSQNSYISNAC